MTANHDRVRETTLGTGAEPDAALLRDLVARIVRAARPERIILFGSAAEGRMGPHSDLDLLVVKAGNYAGSMSCTQSGGSFAGWVRRWIWSS